MGLSTSLRFEAETAGVRVSVLCPSAVETPIIDRGSPPEVSVPGYLNVRRYLVDIAGPVMPVDAFARYALDRIDANDGVIVAPAATRVGFVVFRFVPALGRARVRRALVRALAERPTSRRRAGALFRFASVAPRVPQGTQPAEGRDLSR